MDLKNKQLIIKVGVITSIIVIVLLLRQESDIDQTKSSDRSPTWSEAPRNIKVPEEGDTGFEESIAIPLTVVEDSKLGDTWKVAASTRIFEIRAVGDRFIPSTVIVYQGDRLHLKISAEDKDYDFYQPDYGNRQTIKAGETKAVSFRAVESGQFTFFCETCGGPASGPKGFLIVKPNE